MPIEYGLGRIEDLLLSAYILRNLWRFYTWRSDEVARNLLARRFTSRVPHSLPLYDLES